MRTNNINNIKERRAMCKEPNTELVVRCDLKENSTGMNIVKLLLKQDRLYKHSFFALSKAGNETEEQAFRACELLLN